MIALLAAVSLPYVRQNILRIVLTLVGVVIGVQGMVAMSALNTSIVRSFEDGVTTIAGNAALQISGPESGIPESLVREAEEVAGVESATALIQSSFTTGDAPYERVAVFGVDLLGTVGTRSPQFPREHVHIADELEFLNARDSIALAQPLLDRLHLGIGQTLRLATPSGPRTFTVRGTLDSVGPAKLFDGAVGLVDLGTAQTLILAPSLVQTIYVVVRPGEQVEAVADRLRATIGTRARVERSDVRGRQVDAILSSLRVALALASLITMIVAYFIISQTVTMSVEQRRRDIAVARVLGFTKRSVAAVVLVESLLLGALGSALGVAAGYALARGSLATAVAGVSDAYLPLGTTELHLALVPTLVAALFGLGTCVLAGLVPASRAATQPPAEVLRAASGVSTDGGLRRRTLAGIAVLVVSLLALRTELHLDSSEAKTAWIMLGHTTLIVAVALLSPAFVQLWSRLVSPLGNRGALALRLGVDFFARRPRRAAANVCAIMVGYALVIVNGSAIVSLENAMTEWFSHVFNADLLVMTPLGLGGAPLDDGLARRIADVQGVASVERHRKGPGVYDGHPIVMTTFDRRRRPDREPLLVLRAMPGAYDAAENAQAVFVSDSFTFRYGKDLGDHLQLDTAFGRRDFAIAAVIRDYAFDLGTILVDGDVYRRLWQDTHLTNLNLWLAPGADLTRVRASVEALVGDDPHISVMSNRELRVEMARIIERLLAVLGSVQVFTCAIAIFGVVNFLLATVVDRRREIALLRSVGLARSQVRQAIVVEAALLGCAGISLGIVAGFPSALLFVTHSLRTMTGWSLGFRFPLAYVALTGALVVLAATVAGYIPARRIAATNVLAGLRTE